MEVPHDPRFCLDDPWFCLECMWENLGHMLEVEDLKLP